MNQQVDKGDFQGLTETKRQRLCKVTNSEQLRLNSSDDTQSCDESRDKSWRKTIITT